MVEPTGVPIRIEIIIPKNAQRTDRIAEKIVTDLKLLNKRIAEIAGNMTSAEINKEPTKFIAKTIITAIIIAINKLYFSVLIPVAFAKSSSNVTAKIIW